MESNALPQTQEIDRGKIQRLPRIEPGQSNTDFDHVQKYLHRFGYLPDMSKTTAGKLDEETSRSLTELQRFFRVGELGCFDESTRDLLCQTRCGMTDPPAAAAPGPWSRRNLSYAFGRITSQVATGRATSAIRQAIATWEAAGHGLSFREVSAAANPDVLIEWRPPNDPDFGMTGLIMAHSDYPPPNGEIHNNLPRPLHFDESELWAIGPTPNFYDIETVALHEFGHILGLRHSSSNTVMRSIIPRGSVLRNLQFDDLAGLGILYPATF